MTEQSYATGHEPVEPAILDLAVELHITGIAATVRRPRAASPVERDLRVHVIADREIVTDIVDLPAVGGTVAKQLTQTEARRQNPAAASGAHVLEDERQPQDRNVTDVQHRGPRHHQTLGDHLDLTGAEVVIGDRVVAAGNGAAPDVERRLLSPAGVADECRRLAVHEP